MIHVTCLRLLLLFTCFDNQVYSEIDEAELEKQFLEDEANYNTYKDYIPEIEVAFAIQMLDEFGLLWNGNSHQMHGKVEILGMEFIAYRRASIPEARALCLTVMDKFVKAINAHDNIQPFLEVQPFNYGHVKVSISFKGENGCYCDGSVSSVSTISEKASDPADVNKLIYYTSDAYSAKSNVILRESHEEAVRLAESFPIQDLSVHESSEWEDAVDKTLVDLREEMADKYGLSCWYIGGDMQEGIKDIRANFRIFRPANVNQARQLFVEITERFLSVVNEKLRPYLKDYPLTPDKVKLFIGFKNRNYHSHPESQLEEVTLDNGEISYFRLFNEDEDDYADSIGSGRTILETKENYQDALGIVEKSPQNIRHFSPSPFSDLAYALYMRSIYLLTYLYYFIWYLFQ